MGDPADHPFEYLAVVPREPVLGSLQEATRLMRGTDPNYTYRVTCVDIAADTRVSHEFIVLSPGARRTDRTAGYV